MDYPLQYNNNNNNERHDWLKCTPVSHRRQTFGFVYALKKKKKCTLLSTRDHHPHDTWFFSVYSPDMPSRLPIQDICAGLLTSVGTAIRYWFHYTLVAFAWLGVVPLTACKYLRL